MAPEGTVKWFDNKKGFGFKTLREGQRVSFEGVEGDKGLRAANANPIQAPVQGMAGGEAMGT